MAPLTRNQQAARQAQPSQAQTQSAPSCDPAAAALTSSSSSSSSARLRSEGGQSHAGEANRDQIFSHAVDLHPPQDKGGRGRGKAQSCSVNVQPTLHTLEGDLGAFEYGKGGETMDTAATASANITRIDGTPVPLSNAFEHDGALRNSSTDWASFAQSSGLAESMSQPETPFYSMQEDSFRRQPGSSGSVTTATPSLMDNLTSGGGFHHQRDDIFGHSWRPNDSSDRTGGSVGMEPSFSTPSVSAASSSKHIDHTRAFSHSHISLPQRRLPSTHPSGSLALDLHEASNPLHLHLSQSPSDARHITGMAANQGRGMIHDIRNMPQTRLGMAANHDDFFPFDGPMHPSSIDPYQVKNRIMSQSSSFRSPSPSDHSAASTAFLSPHTSISTMRHGDSSVDTSIDSVSNSATSMSANPSRASSTSDELKSIGTSTSSRKSAKGKTRLRNLDRKLICEFARDNPKVKQEHLAAHFGIERSTVSKTLKNKDKWLAIEEESEGAMIIKHRNGKFPLLEAKLAEWIREEAGKGNTVLDIAIKHRALEIAKESGLTVDSFKASVGWIEKFRERHDLHKPVNSSSSSSENIARSSGNLFSSLRRGLHGVGDEVLESEQAMNDVSGALNEGEGMMMSSTSEVDMASLFSPSDGMLRSQPSPSSMSTEESGGGMVAAHETPKASKRHYDDMDANQRVPSSIDFRMARMHFPQRPDDSGLLTLQDSPEDHHSSLLLGSTEDETLSSSASKRRKGATSQGTMVQPANRPDSNTRPTQAMRDHLRRTRSDSHQLMMIHDEVQQQQQQPTYQQSSHQRQQSQVTAAAVAAANEIRQMEGVTAEIQQRQKMLQTMNSSDQQESNKTTDEIGEMLDGTHSHHQGPLLPPSPSYSFSISGAGPYEDRQVTLDEARDSLELVLAFIARQPANLSASDYFVLGNLQGTLSALAGQNQHVRSQLQQQSTNHMSPGQQPLRHQQQHQQLQQRQQPQPQQQQQSPEQMNMLGISRSH